MQIELAGLVQKAAELLDLGTQLPLKIPVELPFGTPGVCVRLPVLFSLIQPVCCAEGGVTDSGSCGQQLPTCECDDIDLLCDGHVCGFTKEVCFKVRILLFLLHDACSEQLPA